MTTICSTKEKAKWRYVKKDHEQGIKLNKGQAQLYDAILTQKLIQLIAVPGTLITILAISFYYRNTQPGGCCTLHLVQHPYSTLNSAGLSWKEILPGLKYPGQASK